MRMLSTRMTDDSGVTRILTDDFNTRNGDASDNAVTDRVGPNPDLDNPGVDGGDRPSIGARPGRGGDFGAGLRDTLRGRIDDQLDDLGYEIDFARTENGWKLTVLDVAGEGEGDVFIRERHVDGDVKTMTQTFQAADEEVPTLIMVRTNDRGEQSRSLAIEDGDGNSYLRARSVDGNVSTVTQQIATADEEGVAMTMERSYDRDAQSFALDFELDGGADIPLDVSLNLAIEGADQSVFGTGSFTYQDGDEEVDVAGEIVGEWVVEDQLLTFDFTVSSESVEVDLVLTYDQAEKLLSLYDDEENLLGQIDFDDILDWIREQLPHPADGEVEAMQMDEGVTWLGQPVANGPLATFFNDADVSAA